MSDREWVNNAMSNRNQRSVIANARIKKGAKVGFYLSLIYNLIFPVIWLYTDTTRQIVVEPDYRNLITTMIVMPFYGLLVGCIPATILGAITGWLIERIFSLVQSHLASLMSICIGLSIATCIALMINSFVILSSEQTGSLIYSSGYLTLLGIPTVIYILASAVSAYKLYIQEYGRS